MSYNILENTLVDWTSKLTARLAALSLLPLNFLVWPSTIAPIFFSLASNKEKCKGDKENLNQDAQVPTTHSLLCFVDVELLQLACGFHMQHHLYSIFRVALLTSSELREKLVASLALLWTTKALTSIVLHSSQWNWALRKRPTVDTRDTRYSIADRTDRVGGAAWCTYSWAYLVPIRTLSIRGESYYST